MSAREELKSLYEKMVWEQEMLHKQIIEIENKFSGFKTAYAMIEQQLKIFKDLLKEF